MYEPKPYEPGGNEPGDETPGYDQSGGGTTAECTCEEWPVEVPGETQPFRRLILALKEALRELPPETAKKFEDELKDAEKESQGIPAVVAKYKEFYDKLDSKLSEAKCWKEEIARWLKGKLSQAAKDAIEEFRETNYDDLEKKICCDWLRLRDRLNRLRDCLEQAKRTEEERKKDYDDFKAFEKELSGRFDRLKALFEQAKALNTEQRYKAVFAVSLEFREIYDDLGLVRDWANARRECGTGNGYGETGQEPTPGGGQYGGQEPTPTPEGGGYGEQTPPEYGEQPEPEYGGYGQGGGGLKEQWTPDKFKTRLTSYLRALVLAKYQRFRWQVFFQTQTADADKGEKDCKAFRDERQKQFIDEADDIATPEPSGSEEEGEQPSGGYPEKPPTGGYPKEPPKGGYPEKPPTGGYPEKLPAGGGYQQKPPAGNYPDKPTHPPTGEYQDTPVQQPDTYQGRQKK